MDEDEITAGAFVRVRGDCPHTMPHYARVMVGKVVEVYEDGLVEVLFGSDRRFPVPLECLVLTDANEF